MHEEFTKPQRKDQKYSVFLPKNLFYPKPDREEEPHPWEGMNPNVMDSLIFDSMFESGNLDMVVKKAENEYDMYMRVDTNTRGHH